MSVAGDAKLGDFGATKVEVSVRSKDTSGREMRIQIQVSVVGNSSPVVASL